MKPSLFLFSSALLLCFHSSTASELKNDEELIYFPTNGSWDESSGHWQVPVHGWIFETERDSLWRNGALSLLKERLGVAPQSEQSGHLLERGWPFLVDNESGKSISVRIDGKAFPLSPSMANGHLYGNLTIKDRGTGSGIAKQWLPFETAMPNGDLRQYRGEVQLLGVHGLSVVSDIDDTIKISNVLDKEALLANTFLRDFQAVPGMAEHYRRWEAAGAAFHYITGSPWQLYPSLSKFLDTSGFPRGSFDMRNFRLKDSSFLDFIASAEEFKVETISTLLQRFPERRFILIGDSGEKDPEVYGAITRRFPNQVAAIYIRNISGETMESPRMQAAFAEIPHQLWRLFNEPDDLTIMMAEQ